MTQTEGLAVLFAWLIFAALLCLLGFFVLRTPHDVTEESKRRTDGSRDR